MSKTVRNKSYRSNVSTSEAFYVFRIMLILLFSLLAAVILYSVYQSNGGIGFIIGAGIAVLVCIAMLVWFLWCYATLTGGGHIAKGRR